MPRIQISSPERRRLKWTERLDTGLIVENFFHQRAARALNHVAFDLILQPVGINDEAAVMRHTDFLDDDFAG